MRRDLAHEAGHSSLALPALPDSTVARAARQKGRGPVTIPARGLHDIPRPSTGPSPDEPLTIDLIAAAERYTTLGWPTDAATVRAQLDSRTCEACSHPGHKPGECVSDAENDDTQACSCIGGSK